MNIKNILQSVSDFIINRTIQLLGLILMVVSILLILSLITYSAEDPNFIYSNNNQIKNILGFNGSVISDFFLQSIGLVSFIFAASILVTGFNVIVKRKLMIVVENLFFIICYIIVCCIISY